MVEEEGFLKKKKKSLAKQNILSSNTENKEGGSLINHIQYTGLILCNRRTTSQRQKEIPPVLLCCFCGQDPTDSGKGETGFAHGFRGHWLMVPWSSVLG